MTLDKTINSSEALGSGPASPCIDVCVLDPVTGWCRGCKRTITEIAEWGSYDTVQKQTVLHALKTR